MTTRDNDGVSKGHKASHAAKLRGGTPVANTRSDKTTNATLIKSKETVTERQREKTRWNTEKDDENVENISHDKVENLQPGEDKNHRKKSHLDIISIVVASIAVFIAIYPHLFSIPLSEPEKPLKVGPADIHTQQQFINGLSERLSIVESRLSDIKQCTCRTDDTPNIDENLEFENRVIKSESDLSGEVSANKEELKDLKDEVQKLKDQIDVKFGDIENVQEEHKALQAEVIHLNEKLGERSQFVEQRNAEVSQQMFLHNETLRDLNLHVENIGSTLNTLNEYVKSRVITSLSDMLGNITANNMETEILKDKVQKINEGLQINVTRLERQLGEQSQSEEKKNIEMIQLILQHNETLNGLVVSVENQCSSLHSLDVSATNHGTNLHNLKVSVERLQTNVTTLERILLEQAVTNRGTNLHNLNVSVERLQTNVTTLERKLAELSVTNHGTNLHNLNVSVERLQTNVTTLERKLAELAVTNHGTNLHNLNVSVERRQTNVTTLERKLAELTVTNHGTNLHNLNLSVERLQTNVTTLERKLAELSVTNHGTNLHNLNVSVGRLQTNVTTLERKLAEQSQSSDKKNIEMMQQLLQQNETLNGLVVSATNHGTNLHNLNVSVEILQTNVTTLERKIGEQSQSAEKKNIEMMQLMLQHNETLNGLVASVENHGSNLHNLNVSVENLGSNLNIINVSLEGHDNTLRSLNVSVKTLDSSLHSLNDFADSLDSSLRSLNVSVENHGCNISDLNVSVDNLRSNVKNITENITGISIETLVLEKKTEHLVDNIFDKGSLIMVIMIITTLLVLVIIYLVASRNTKRHLNEIVDSQQQQSPAPYSTAGRILSKVRANLCLERKLCVISFYEETHPLHMRMTQSVTQSVTQQLNQELEEFIIRRHEDILECPPVSLYFLFVDFNERNVILEDPTLELGDLRLTTVQAVQKMGGKIVIFYVRDLNSRHLNPMKLYNEDLASVTKQRELSALSRLCRFISAYDQLTDNQKAHLRQILVQELYIR